MRRGRAQGKTDGDLVKMVEDLAIETKEGNRIWLPMTIQGVLGRAVARYARIGHRRCHSGPGADDLGDVGGAGPVVIRNQVTADNPRVGGRWRGLRAHRVEGGASPRRRGEEPGGPA
jgi:hypothetical protein